MAWIVFGLLVLFPAISLPAPNVLGWFAKIAYAGLGGAWMICGIGMCFGTMPWAKLGLRVDYGLISTSLLIGLSLAMFVDQSLLSSGLTVLVPNLVPLFMLPQTYRVMRWSQQFDHLVNKY
jgi:hypothetical protein